MQRALKETEEPVFMFSFVVSNMNIDDSEMSEEMNNRRTHTSTIKTVEVELLLNCLQHSKEPAAHRLKAQASTLFMLNESRGGGWMFRRKG
jgi:hypothetical protein